MALRFRGCAAAATFFLGIADSLTTPTRWRWIRLTTTWSTSGIDPFEAYALLSARCDMRLGGPASAVGTQTGQTTEPPRSLTDGPPRVQGSVGRRRWPLSLVAARDPESSGPPPIRCYLGASADEFDHVPR